MFRSVATDVVLVARRQIHSVREGIRAGRGGGGGGGGLGRGGGGQGGGRLV